MQRAQLNTLVHEVPTNVPVLPSGRFRHFLTSRSRRSSNLTNARSHTPSREQPAPKPVDVFGPSDPRTRRRTSLLSQSSRPGSVVCARQRALPPAVSPLGRALCSFALPSLAGWSAPSRSARDRWLPGEERARRMARQSDEYSVRNRCYSTQPHNAKVEENRITRMQKGTIIKGRPPFCHHQCSRTAARPRAVLPRCNVQSTDPLPTT